MCERALWSAVLLRGMQDACARPLACRHPTPAAARPHEIDHARAWLLSSDAVMVAHLAGVEPQCLRAWAAEAAATGWHKPVELDPASQRRRLHWPKAA